MDEAKRMFQANSSAGSPDKFSEYEELLKRAINATDALWKKFESDWDEAEHLIEFLDVLPVLYRGGTKAENREWFSKLVGYNVGYERLESRNPKNRSYKRGELPLADFAYRIIEDLIEFKINSPIGNEWWVQDYIRLFDPELANELLAISQNPPKNRSLARKEAYHKKLSDKLPQWIRNAKNCNGFDDFRWVSFANQAAKKLLKNEKIYDSIKGKVSGETEGTIKYEIVKRVTKMVESILSRRSNSEYRRRRRLRRRRRQI